MLGRDAMPLVCESTHCCLSAAPDIGYVACSRQQNSSCSERAAEVASSRHRGLLKAHLLQSWHNRRLSVSKNYRQSKMGLKMDCCKRVDSEFKTFEI